MAPHETNPKTLTMQCYCKAVHFTLTLNTSDLPLSTHLCHCSICRYTHGTLCVFHAPLPANVIPEFVAPSSQDKLTPYRIPNSDSIYHFCSTCGCHVGGSSVDYTDWAISTSIFVDNEPVYQINSHVFSKSAPGGGYDEFLPRIGERVMKDWNPKDDSALPKHSEAEVGADGEERLRAECHCGGVSFTIPRPSEVDINNPQIKRFVSPVDKSKWVASIDACDDCRLTSGTHVVSWTFIPLEHCKPNIKSDLMIGTTKTFASSPGILRSFCGVCGATIFYASNDRPKVVDLAVGILRAPEGARAENWLTWRAGSIGYVMDGQLYNEELMTSLAEGFKNWSMNKYGHDGSEGRK